MMTPLDRAYLSRQQLARPFPTHEWNPIMGCKPKSRGCLHCHAATKNARLYAAADPKYFRIDRRGVSFTGEMSFSESVLNKPRTDVIPEGSVVFAISRSDLFADPVPDSWIKRVADVMSETPHIIYNLVTKYTKRLSTVLHEHPLRFGSNVRIGFSAETQILLDERSSDLMNVILNGLREKLHVSMEPMLEPMILPRMWSDENCEWVVAMREVNSMAAKTMDPAWVKAAQEDCKARFIPFYWETSHMDGMSCVQERIAAENEGRAYFTQLAVKTQLVGAEED